MGLAYHGTVYLSETPDIPPADVRATFSHERIHVLQGDAVFLSLGLPAQEWLAARIPGGRWVSRWMDVDVAAPLTTVLGQVIPYDERPWEMEASYLQER